jgi:hypothetical protein
MKLTRRTFNIAALCALLLPTAWLGRGLVLRNNWVLREED